MGKKDRGHKEVKKPKQDKAKKGSKSLRIAGRYAN